MLYFFQENNIKAIKLNHFFLFFCKDRVMLLNIKPFHIDSLCTVIDLPVLVTEMYYIGWGG